MALASCCRLLRTPRVASGALFRGPALAVAPTWPMASFATLKTCTKPLGSVASSIPTSSRGTAIDVPKAVGWWLMGCSASVFGMVVLGGYTRLTRSGLSMTDWKVQGTALPASEEEWQAAFARYREFPEYQRLNKGMSLEEFKEIYFVEWAHRMAGRAVGLVFTLPALAFFAAGMVPGALVPRLGLMFTLGGSQGLVGWWMVKSGLEEPPADLDGVPRVSPYRLACHLAMAFTIYSLLFSTALDILRPPAQATAAELSDAARRAVDLARPRARSLAALVAITAISGAFVAGMQAGYAYNTFPLMDGKLVPEGYWSLTPWYRNLFENVPAVQFDHRLLATTSLTAATAFWISTRKLALPPPARLATNALLIATSAQVALGIFTLVSAVPVHLGTAHQAGALTVFSVTLFLLNTLRRLPVV